MQRMINIENYEAYLLDYLEGNLTEREEQELLRFLDAHPGLKGSLEDYETVRLSPPEVSYEKKHSLRKPDLSFESIDDLNAEEAMAAFYEGDLSPRQQRALDAYLKDHPEMVRDYKLYGKVFLVPPADTFDKKPDLIRKERKIVVWYPAVAAAVALLLVFSFFLRQQRELPVPSGSPDVAETTQQALPVRNPVPPEKITKEIMASEPEKKVADLSKGEVKKVEVQKPAWQITRVSPEERVVSKEVNARVIPDERKEMLAYRPVLGPSKLPVTVPATSLATPVSLQTEPLPDKNENIDLLAEKAGLRIRKNLLKNASRRRTPREIFFTGLEKINTATGLNLNYEKMEEPEQGLEYVAVHTRFFSYVRRKGESK